MSKSIKVTYCGDCPNMHGKYCGLLVYLDNGTSSYVINEFREKVLPKQCPLREPVTMESVL